MYLAVRPGRLRLLAVRSLGGERIFACAEPLVRTFKPTFPQGKIMFSSWCFDHFTPGE